MVSGKWLGAGFEQACVCLPQHAADYPLLTTHHSPLTTQANVCLMQHAADAVVSASVAHATNTLYARAGINLAEVMQRATAG